MKPCKWFILVLGVPFLVLLALVSNGAMQAQEECEAKGMSFGATDKGTIDCVPRKNIKGELK